MSDATSHPRSSSTPALKEVQVSCSKCNLRELCMPVRLREDEIDVLDRMIASRRRVARGKPLFSNGDRFSAIYAIRSGTFKTRINTADGRDQVTGFHVSGEIVGLDGMGGEAHACDALALEDSEVCVIPYDRLEEASRACNTIQQHFHRLMSREIVRDHGVMLLLGSMRAEERLAAFLLNLVTRMRARGFSGSELILRMTREEIGSYLGLKLETVSRTFSKFAEEGLISVNQRHIRIEKPDKLREMVGTHA